MSFRRRLFKLQTTIRHPGRVYTHAVRKVKGWLLWDYYYYSLREPKARSAIFPHPKTEDITDNLKKNGFNIVDFEIDVADFGQYLKKAEYDKFPNYYGGGKGKNFFEKSLEHYLTTKILKISKDDVYIDIASENSPTTEIIHKLYGCEAYRQDLIFPRGIQGNTIGGDAGNMPVKDGFATRMALHCSFEHFEQDADMRFMKEASRVLKKGGKLCIAPLYLFDKYVILTDPAVLPRKGVPFDSDAILYCMKDWGERHARFYDVPHLVTRIKNSSGLKLTIHVVQNEKEVDTTCYVKFIALFEKE
jgi:SAM-dependent methyltransferase